MSHVDDGTIHAWLDGALLPDDPERVTLEAHLAECDECRARVDAEREIRGRAVDVLRTVAPDAVRVEPFQSMIAARRAARAVAAAGAEVAPENEGPVPGQVDSATPITKQPRRRRRYVPLAWAASLLMAVTAGWFARSYIPFDTAPASPAAEADLAAPALQEQPTISRTAPDEEVVSPAAAGDPTVGNVAVEGGAVSEAGRDVVEPGRVAFAETQAAAKTEAESRAADQATGGVRRSTEETRQLADAIVLDEAREQDVAAPTPEVPLIPDTGSMNESSAAVLETYRSAVWQAVTEEEASDRLGRAAARIDGLPIDSLQSAPHGTGWLVRVVQRTETGEIAEILQWQEAIRLDEVVVTGQTEQKRIELRSDVAADSARQRVERMARVAAAAAPPPAAEPALDNRATLQLSGIGFRVLLRANVSPDVLGALAQRIR